MRFHAKGQYFELDGKPFFLYSGEIQYFRVDRELWRVHLQKLKAAGGNMVTTYIPWSWHEIAEGRFDFNGETDPQRDILGFIEMAAEEGLLMALKPGPYILAEFEDRGIPAWLMEKHPEIQAVGVDQITYLHPTFQEYVQKWYAAILPLLATHQISRDGNIVLLQVCNEVGLFNWLDGSGDYSPLVVKLYQQYLKKEYKKIETLNKIYRSKFRSFEKIPAPSKPTEDSGDYVYWNDWHDFHRWYFSEYLSWVIREIRSCGIDIQLYHNIPGWVFGRGQEYPVNISFYAEIIKRHPEMVFGVDHIPENPNYRNQHDDLIINEMTRAIQGGNGPIWAAEQQAGTREHTVHTFPNEMELFYKACFIRGMNGMNFYMFSQGKNPHRRGAFGPTFYWMTALGHDGSEKPLYPVIKKLGGMIKSFGSNLAAAKKNAQTSVVFYRPYYHDEFYYPLFGGVPKLNPAAVGLRYSPKVLRNTYYYEGVLRMLTIQNRDFDMVDLQIAELDPKKQKQLYAVLGDCMDRESQEKLADYVEAGGHLILMPGFPEKDLKMRTCSILRTRLGIREGKPAQMTGIGKFDLLDIQDINCLTPIRTFLNTEGCKEIAQTPDRQCCGVQRKVGKGTVSVLGTAFSYNIKEHLWAFDKLYELKGNKRAVDVSNHVIQAHVRYGKDHAFVGVLNYTPLAQKLSLVVRDVPGVGDVHIPEKGELLLPAVSGLIIPLNYPLQATKDSTRLLWASCEVLELTERPEGIVGTVQLSPFQETLMEWAIPESNKVQTCRINESAVKFVQTAGRVRIELPRSEQAVSLQIRW